MHTKDGLRLIVLVVGGWRNGLVAAGLCEVEPAKNGFTLLKLLYIVSN